MRNSKGFTLIELVVVIVILGILAAFAAPKFISLESDARSSSIQGLAGAVKASNSLVHALALAKGQTGATGSVTVSGASVGLVYGYPAGTAAGITSAIDLDAADYTGAYASGAATYTITGYSGGTCQVVFTQAADASTPPTVVTTTTGC